MILSRYSKNEYLEVNMSQRSGEHLYTNYIQYHNEACVINHSAK